MLLPLLILCFVLKERLPLVTIAQLAHAVLRCFHAYSGDTEPDCTVSSGARGRLLVESSTDRPI